MKKFISLVSTLVLGLTLASPMVSATENVGGANGEAKNLHQELKDGLKGKVKELKEKHGENKDKRAEAAACLKTSKEARNAAYKSLKETHLNALKAANQTAKDTVNAARAIYNASAKDDAAKTALKAAIKTARTVLHDVRKVAREARKTALTARKDAWKTAHDQCVETAKSVSNA